MKYPFIIFYRHDQYKKETDIFYEENKDQLNCTIFFTDKKEDLNKLFNSNYQILITYGLEESEYVGNCNEIIAPRMRDRWIHYKTLPNINQFNYSVNYCFITNCAHNREDVRPVFSIFTTTYNSYHKITRAYDSLKKQELKDWEWVIVDDSPDDEHFIFLRKELCEDQRIRLYRRSENNGSIGNVKNEAVMLCRGKYVLEFDHDDIILPFVLYESAKLFDKNDDIGFIYMDFINIYENGENFWYGNFIAKGYASYYCQKYEGRWVFVHNTANINNITLSHLVSCPNHPRIWRKDVLLKIGNYSEFLPVCDDFEILLRTAVNTKIAKINKFGYVQFMNNNNNNFSLIRNGEINRIGPNYIYNMYYDRFKINEYMKDINAYENEKYIYNHSQIWLRDDEDKSVEDSGFYKHNYCNLLVNDDYDKQFCIINVESLMENLDKIKELSRNQRNDFILLDNKNSNEQLWDILNQLNLTDFKFFALKDNSVDIMKKYFIMRYKTLENYEFI